MHKPSLVFGVVVFSILASVIGILAILAGLSFFQLKRNPYYSESRVNFAKGYFVADRFLGWKLIPSFRVYGERDQELIFHTDPYGFRNLVPVPQKGAAMFLGDSFMQGYFLHTSETIPTQFSKLVGRHVYNFGMGAYSTDQEFLVALEALKRFRVEWVVLGFYINDLPFNDVGSNRGLQKPTFAVRDGKVDFSSVITHPDLPDAGRPFESPKIEETIGTLKEKLKFAGFYPPYWVRFFTRFVSNANHLVSFLKNPVQHIRDLRGNVRFGRNLAISQLEFPQIAYSDPNAFKREWGIVRQYFARLQKISRAAGAQFLIVMIPEKFQMKLNEKTFFGPQAKLRDICIADKMNCLDLSHPFLKAAQKQHLYFEDDGHLSPYGARIAAESIFEYLTKPLS